MSSNPSYDHLDETTYNELYKPMQQDAEGNSSSAEEPLLPSTSPNRKEQQHQYHPLNQYSPATQNVDFVGATPQNQLHGRNRKAPVKPPHYMWLSCLTFWFCCWILGAVAFFISWASKSAASDGRIEEARVQGKTALRINIAGIVIGVIAIAFLIGFTLLRPKDTLDSWQGLP